VTYQETSKTKFTVLLDRIDHLPAIMTVAQLLQTSSAPGSPRHRTTRIDVLRLVELTDRTSAVMRGSEASELLRRDALVKVFEMFGKLNRIVVSSALSVVPQSLYASSVIEHAKDVRADLMVLPWTAGPPATVGATLATGVTPTDIADEAHAGGGSTGYSPFQGLFGLGNSSAGNATDTAVLYSQFIRQVFSNSPTDVALLVDRVDDVVGVGTPSTSATIDARAVDGHHIFLPFVGGPDDRLALTLVAQLCAGNSGVSATVVRITKSEQDMDLTTAGTRNSITDLKAQHAQNFTITSAVCIINSSSCRLLALTCYASGWQFPRHGLRQRHN
jgi:hypothetical protein